MNPIPTPSPRPAPAPGRPFAPPHGGGPFRDVPARGGGGGQPPRGPRRAGGRGGRPGNVRRRIERMLRRPTAPLRKPQGAEYYPEAPAANTMRVVPLGGVEEVGRNMLALDVNGDIFVFDIGFHFRVEDDAPGADYTLPNSKYLEKNRERVRAVIITHGHLDHIGGIPFILPRIGNPPVYTP